MTQNLYWKSIFHFSRHKHHELHDVVENGPWKHPKSLRILCNMINCECELLCTLKSYRALNVQNRWDELFLPCIRSHKSISIHLRHAPYCQHIFRQSYLAHCVWKALRWFTHARIIFGGGVGGATTTAVVHACASTSDQHCNLRGRTHACMHARKVQNHRRSAPIWFCQVLLELHVCVKSSQKFQVIEISKASMAPTASSCTNMHWILRELLNDALGLEDPSQRCHFTHGVSSLFGIFAFFLFGLGHDNFNVFGPKYLHVKELGLLSEQLFLGGARHAAADNGRNDADETLEWRADEGQDDGHILQRLFNFVRNTCILFLANWTKSIVPILWSSNPWWKTFHLSQMHVMTLFVSMQLREHQNRNKNVPSISDINFAHQWRVKDDVMDPNPNRPRIQLWKYARTQKRKQNKTKN